MGDASTLEAIRAFAVDRCDSTDGAHDALHLRRVVANARALLDEETHSGRQVDAFVVEAAAWLHDVVLLPKGQGLPGEAAKRSADLARSLLDTLGVDTSRIEAVAAAIASHSFSGGLAPASVESAIVQDADRLDALGAIGIARFWVTMQRLGGQLYHPDEPLPITRDLDDRAFALDHLERKLLRLVDLMNTTAGRFEAERRTAFLRTYRDEFLRELAPIGPR